MLATGSEAPAFILPDLTGSEQSLDTLLSGDHPVLLAFFKVSCPTCQLTLPYLERFRQDGGLHVVGISQNVLADTREFASHYKLSYAMLLDDTKKYPASNAYRLTSVPSLFLVAPDRQILWSSEGFSKKDLEALGSRLGFISFHEKDRVPLWKPG